MITTRFLISLLLWLIGLFMTWRIPNFMRRSTQGSYLTSIDVSIVIPARNEAHNIGHLLTSLRRQTFKPREIIVIDDSSTDETVAVAREGGAFVLPAGDLPAGWVGKSWACWRGVQRARGNTLVFLDADTCLEPEGLTRILSRYVERGGLLTVQPYHDVRRLDEELSAFFNIIVMAGVNAFTPLGARWVPGGGFGPCVVCDRCQYLQIGGHQSSRSKVLEDITLAREYVRHGLPVSCFGGKGAIRFRMYPGGFREVVEGWSKGFGAGAVSIHPLGMLLVTAWVFGCFSAFYGILKAAGSGEMGVLISQGLIYALYAMQIGWTLARIGSFRMLTAALFPIPLVFFAFIMLRSLIMIHVLRKVSWKERDISLSTKDDAP